MNAIEFVTELTGGASLVVPAEAAARLPQAGKARVIVLTDASAEDQDWQHAAYGQFLRDDAPEDAIYDSLR
jgi:uncharacterized protein YaiL (DUF2058 family)